MKLSLSGDSRKAASNLKKHAVSFEEACEVFFDPFLCVLEDKGEAGEPREAIIGLTPDWQMLYVIFIECNSIIRIISAREVSRQEKWQYENQ
jgi:uncharacterized protein